MSAGGPTLPARDDRAIPLDDRDELRMTRREFGLGLVRVVLGVKIVRSSRPAIRQVLGRYSFGFRGSPFLRSIARTLLRWW